MTLTPSTSHLADDLYTDGSPSLARMHDRVRSDALAGFPWPWLALVLPRSHLRICAWGQYILKRLRAANR